MTTPRYQLPESFGPLPPGFREEFNRWALDFFGTVEREPAPAPAPAHSFNLYQGETPTGSLSELLDNIGTTFDNLRMRDLSTSWVDKETRLGLRRIGVYVPHPWALPIGRQAPINCDVSRGFPALISVSFPIDEKRSKPGWVHPTLFFAVKLNRLPAEVTQHRGAAFYQVGAAVCDRADGTLHWTHLFVAVDVIGRVKVCDEFTPMRRQIPTRSAAARRQHGRAIYFSVKRWHPPAMFRLFERETIGGEEEGSTIPAMSLTAWWQNLFAGTFNWWSRRRERWSVAVTYRGDRVTFSIDNKNAPSWFADRDKTVRTPTGQAKRILHIVREHERHYPGGRVVVVPQHVRGLREFDWHGYHCAITAPGFTGYTTDTFRAPSYHTRKNRPGMVGLDAIIPTLLAVEDNDLRAKARAKRARRRSTS